MTEYLIIACSPRQNGNSDIIANIAYKTLENAKKNVQLIYLRQLNFSPCIACGKCDIEGKCSLKDDLKQIYPMLLSAEKIILVAPIFFENLGALPKGFIDRMQCYWVIKYLLHKTVIPDVALRKKRKTFAMFCAASDSLNTFICAEKSVKLFGHIIEAKYAGGLFFSNIDAKGDILKQTSNIRKIEEAVLNL